MFKIKLIFKKDLKPGQIKLVEVPSTRRIDKNLEDQCLKEWEKIKENAMSKGQRIWDSEVYRYENAVVEDSGGWILQVSTIPYSIRLSMNHFTDIVKKLGLEYGPLGLFLSVFVKTSDNKFVFIEKSSQFYSSRDLSFVGGILSKSENVITSGGDLFKAVKREICEETGAVSGAINKMVLKAGYITENYNFCLVFYCSLDISSHELELLHKNISGGEAKNLIFVKEDKLAEFAKTLPAKDWPKFEILALKGLAL